MNGGPHCLVSSPAPGRSTLITSAPMSPSSIAAYGPASTRARASTCTPTSGPLPRSPQAGPGPPRVGAAAGQRPAAGYGVAAASALAVITEIWVSTPAVVDWKAPYGPNVLLYLL